MPSVWTLYIYHSLRRQAPEAFSLPVDNEPREVSYMHLDNQTLEALSLPIDNPPFFGWIDAPHATTIEQHPRPEHAFGERKGMHQPTAMNADASHAFRTPTSALAPSDNIAQHDRDREAGQSTQQEIRDAAIRKAQEQYNNTVREAGALLAAAVQAAVEQYNVAVRAEGELARGLLSTDHASRQAGDGMSQIIFGDIPNGNEIGGHLPGGDVTTQRIAFNSEIFLGEDGSHTFGSDLDPMSITYEDFGLNMQPSEEVLPTISDTIQPHSLTEHTGTTGQDNSGASLLDSQAELDALIEYKQYVLSCLPDGDLKPHPSTFKWPRHLDAPDGLAQARYCQSWDQKDSYALVFVVDNCNLTWGLIVALFFPKRLVLEYKAQYTLLTKNVDRAYPDEFEDDDCIVREDDLRPPQYRSKDLPGMLHINGEVQLLFEEAMLSHRLENHRLHLLEYLPMQDSVKIAILKEVNGHGWPKHLHSTSEFCKPPPVAHKKWPNEDQESFKCLINHTTLTIAQIVSTFYPHRSLSSAKGMRHRLIGKSPNTWSTADRQTVPQALRAKQAPQVIIIRVPHRSSRAPKDMIAKIKAMSEDTNKAKSMSQEPQSTRKSKKRSRTESPLADDAEEDSGKRMGPSHDSFDNKYLYTLDDELDDDDMADGTYDDISDELHTITMLPRIFLDTGDDTATSRVARDRLRMLSPLGIFIACTTDRLLFDELDSFESFPIITVY
ncbi:hypothetical protein CC86DRAFT_407783 [Ophiobolus disseminans]|uniref:Uncharacterized protein n=1 Tax=Ophiobolus disseminans TaxID=1469910 RepID=A0A6A6ZUY2_9PLEO|nr:hypothetical protein CC86DRAFT_407783 [Ophiobolus disseminans]